MTTTTRAIKGGHDVALLVQLMKSRDKPFTATLTDGLPRTNPQNKTQRKWLNEAAEQLGEMPAEDYRAYCKLHLGVPILRNENEAWAAQYDALIKPLPYEAKLAMMKEPIGFPVTSKMTTKQKTAYLDAMRVHFTSLGVMLTIPGEGA